MSALDDLDLGPDWDAWQTSEEIAEKAEQLLAASVELAARRPRPGRKLKGEITPDVLKKAGFRLLNCCRRFQIVLPQALCDLIEDQLGVLGKLDRDFKPNSPHTWHKAVIFEAQHPPDSPPPVRAVARAAGIDPKIIREWRETQTYQDTVAGWRILGGP